MNILEIVRVRLRSWLGIFGGFLIITWFILMVIVWAMIEDKAFRFLGYILITDFFMFQALVLLALSELLRRSE